MVLEMAWEKVQEMARETAQGRVQVKAQVMAPETVLARVQVKVQEMAGETAQARVQVKVQETGQGMDHNSEQSSLKVYQMGRY